LEHILAGESWHTWVPGNKKSFDGFQGLMIAMCHMTGFIAIEVLKDMNSTLFVKMAYATQLLRVISSGDH
jgi:hypothetical protein